MSIIVEFMSFDSPYRAVVTKKFIDISTAKAAIIAYATTGGFTNVKCKEEDDRFRFTATTPGGRHGRNIAYL